MTGAAITSSVTSTDWACAFVSVVSAEVPNCGPSLPGANAYAGIASVPTMPAATVITTHVREAAAAEPAGRRQRCVAATFAARSAVRVAGAFVAMIAFETAPRASSWWNVAVGIEPKRVPPAPHDRCCHPT